MLTMGNSKDVNRRHPGLPVCFAALVLWLGVTTVCGGGGGGAHCLFPLDRSACLLARSLHVLQSFSPAFIPLLQTQMYCLSSTQLDAGDVVVNAIIRTLQEAGSPSPG